MIYEQPLNEQVRLFLRLEFLFAQVNYYIEKESCWDAQQALKTILEILQTIDRPDLKNKLLQNLNQYLATLSQLENAEEVDKDKLNATLKKIESLIDLLHTNPKKIAHELRENEFLNTAQQRLYIPAGTCGFSMPPCQLWLMQDPSTRKEQLNNWIKHFAQLKDVVDISLKLIREATLFKSVLANGGFYQCNLDPSTTYQMIRISLSTGENFFPEISAGRYRLAIHFFNLNINGHNTQTTNNVEFELACCKI